MSMERSSSRLSLTTKHSQLRNALQLAWLAVIPLPVWSIAHVCDFRFPHGIVTWINADDEFRMLVWQPSHQWRQERNSGVSMQHELRRQRCTEMRWSSKDGHLLEGPPTDLPRSSRCPKNQSAGQVGIQGMSCVSFLSLYQAVAVFVMKLSS